MTARICNTVAYLAPPSRRSSDCEPDDAAMQAYTAREFISVADDPQIREQDRRAIEKRHLEMERMFNRGGRK